MDSAVAQRHEVREAVLRSLQKLNDRSTQKNGVQKLNEIILKQLDAETLGFLISALVQPGTESKPWTRKVNMRLMVTLTTEETCPHARAIFQNATMLTKLCHYLKARLADADAVVHNAAAEVTAQLTKNYRAALGAPLPGTYGNPIMRVALDGLQAQAKEQQLAAASALHLMAPHVALPDPAVVKQLLRYLSSSSFHAKPAVLLAFASVRDTPGLGEGFISNGLDGLRPLLGALVGSPPKTAVPSGAAASAGPGPNGIGVLGCAASPDWQVRKAAADALFALAATLGPELEDGAAAERLRVPRCVDYLRRIWRDRVKPVRDAMSEALAMCSCLKAWMASNPGLTTSAWRRYIRENPAATSRRAEDSADRGATPSGRRDAGDDAAPRDASARRFRATSAAGRPDSTRNAIRTSCAYNQFLAKAAQSNGVISCPDGPVYMPGVEVRVPSREQSDHWPPGLHMPEATTSPTARDAEEHARRNGTAHASADTVTSLDRQDQPPAHVNGASAARFPTASDDGTGQSPARSLHALDGAAGARIYDEPAAAQARYSPDDAATAATLDLRSRAQPPSHFERDLLNDMNQLAHHVTSALEALELRVSALEMTAKTVHHNPVYHNAKPDCEAPLEAAPLSPELEAEQDEAAGASPEGTVHADAQRWSSGGAIAAWPGACPSRRRLPRPASATQLGEAALSHSRRRRPQWFNDARDASAAGMEERSSTATLYSPNMTGERFGPGVDLPRQSTAPAAIPSHPRRAAVPDLVHAVSVEPPTAGDGAADAADAALMTERTTESLGVVRAGIDAAYRAALADDDELALLQLMRETGPVWHELRPNTAQDLIDVMSTWLEGGFALPALLPWLYRLADEENSVQSVVLEEQKARLIQGVQSAASPDDVETFNKYTVLRETLVGVWAQPDDFPRVVDEGSVGAYDATKASRLAKRVADAATELFEQLGSPGVSPMARDGPIVVKDSVASLKALQKNLTDLTRDLDRRLQI